MKKIIVRSKRIPFCLKSYRLCSHYWRLLEHRREKGNVARCLWAQLAPFFRKLLTRNVASDLNENGCELLVAEKYLSLPTTIIPTPSLGYLTVVRRRRGGKYLIIAQKKMTFFSKSYLKSRQNSGNRPLFRRHNPQHGFNIAVKNWYLKFVGMKPIVRQVCVGNYWGLNLTLIFLLRIVDLFETNDQFSK